MKKILLFLICINVYYIHAQQVAIIGYKGLEAIEDGVSILALEDLSAGEVFYFTENEYDNATNRFLDANESVVRITITSAIARGNVIYFEEIAPSSSNTFTTSVTPGSGSVSVLHEASSGSFSIASLGETLYVYTDNDADPTNGVTEIHSAFFPGSGSNPNTGGPIPASQNPSPDFPDALVIHNFPEFSFSVEPYFSNGVNRVEYNTSLADRTNVNRVQLENAANYVFGGNNQDLSTTFFTNFNLVTSLPVATLTTSASQLNEDSSSNFNFTFSLDTPATTDLIINFTVSGNANFGDDYTQTGATSMDTVSGTVTIASGTNSQIVTLNPTGDTILEPDETIELSIVSGTGYDFGSPSTARSIIINDDTRTVTPEVAITGVRHFPVTEDSDSEFSFVALVDITEGAEYVFSNGFFDQSSLTFADIPTLSSELKWTAPTGGITRGDVIVVRKTAPDTFEVTRNGSATSAGTVNRVSPEKDFFISEFFGLFIAHTDTDDNPYNGILEMHSIVYTYNNVDTFGGTIPPESNHSTLYVGAVLVDDFPNTSPGRLEYIPSLRPVITVDQANFEDPNNWIYGAPQQNLSPIPFNNIVISEGSLNPVASLTVDANSLIENSGNSFTYTFNLDTPATTDITINFDVAGTAQLTTDYTTTGANTFSGTTGTITIGTGNTTAQLTITPVNDAVLEPTEDIVISLATGTGYDGGAPNTARATIINDDVNTNVANIALLGINHLEPSGLSIVALEDILPNSTFYFTTGEFQDETLAFDVDRGVLSYTSPSDTCIPQGTVLTFVGPENGPLQVNCNGTSGVDCGTVTIVSGVFDFFDTGIQFYAYTDTDTDPTTQILQIHALLNTEGGTLPPADNPKRLYANAVFVDGFPTGTNPNRTEFDPSLRTTSVSTPLLENISNWLHEQPNAALSTDNFTIEAPVVNCVADATRNTDLGQCSYTVQGAEFDASFSNGCGETLTNNLTGTNTIEGEVLSTGINEIVWTVTNGAGQTVTCTTLITVEDIEEPTVITQDITIRLDITGNASIEAIDIDNGSSDNCSIDTLTIDVSNFDNTNIGANIITLTVTDISGNSATGTATVTVEEPLSPIYVDAANGDNTNSGLGGFANALRDIQVAIDRAIPGAEIRVAAGTYLPTESPDGVSTDPRDLAFHLDKDLIIIGGLDVTDDNDTTPDPATPTILSGDLGTLNDISDNTYHVFITANLTNATRIEGVTISDGNANGSGNINFSGRFFRNQGGGMTNESSSLSLSNVSFINNIAGDGGGMFNSSSSPNLNNVSFINNTANSSGGGMINNSSSPTLNNVIFINNTASNLGGGMLNGNSSPSLTSVSFLNNIADTGGGMFNTLSSSPNLTNVSFVNNTASNGNDIEGIIDATHPIMPLMVQEGILVQA